MKHIRIEGEKQSQNSVITLVYCSQLASDHILSEVLSWSDSVRVSESGV